MRTGAFIARVFLGGMFVISGINGFFHFIPTTSFIATMVGAGDFFYVIKFFEIAIGAMILTGFYMPIALIMLVPISVDIFMFHMSRGMSGMPIAFMIIFAHFYMIYIHREHYAPMIHG